MIDKKIQSLVCRIFFVTIFVSIIYLLWDMYAHASQITVPVVWKNGDTVTDAKLNSINNTFSNVINGGLDNTNMSTGYSLTHSVGSLPPAGNQGTVDFLTSDNSLNIDNGVSWSKAVTVSSPTTGTIPYYNSTWTGLAPGSQNFALVSNGVSSLPSYQILPTTGYITPPGSTGVTQGSIVFASTPTVTTTLVPGISGQYLQTQGASANPQWVTIPESGFNFVSATNVSGAATSGSITLSNNVVYFVQYYFYSLSANDTIRIQFNGDSGADYNQVATGATTTGVITAGSAGSNGIGITGTKNISHATTQGATGSFYISQIGTSQNYQVWGQTFYTDATSGLSAMMSIGGLWGAASNISSFSMSSVGGNTFSGNIYVYKLVIS